MNIDWSILVIGQGLWQLLAARCHLSCHLCSDDGQRLSPNQDLSGCFAHILALFLLVSAIITVGNCHNCHREASKRQREKHSQHLDLT